MREILQRACLITFFTLFGLSSATAQHPGHFVQRWAGTPNGAILVFSIADESYLHLNPEASGDLIAVSVATNKLLWQLRQIATVKSLAISPDGNTVAVGYYGTSELPNSTHNDDSVVFFSVADGHVLGGVTSDVDHDFTPDETFPSGSSGVSGLTFSPDGSLLYGVYNFTVFAYDIAANKPVWTYKIKQIEKYFDLGASLFGVGISPDGKRLAITGNGSYLLTAGRQQPRTLASFAKGGDVVAFSGDSRSVVVGARELHDPKVATYIWLSAAAKPVDVQDCGGGVAWQTKDVFACQNASGAHLRDALHPTKDIGSAGPVSSLPILKVGNSLWVARYQHRQWIDGTKPFQLLIQELGTPNTKTITLPAAH